MIGVRSSWATPSLNERSRSQAAASRCCSPLKVAAIGCSSLGWSISGRGTATFSGLVICCNWAQRAAIGSTSPRRSTGRSSAEVNRLASPAAATSSHRRVRSRWIEAVLFWRTTSSTVVLPGRRRGVRLSSQVWPPCVTNRAGWAAARGASCTTTSAAALVLTLELLPSPEVRPLASASTSCWWATRRSSTVRPAPTASSSP